MRDPVGFLGGVVRLLSLTSIMALGLMPVSTSSAEGVRILCLDEPWMEILDGDRDGTISPEELGHVLSLVPDNQLLLDLSERVEADRLTGIQYDGACRAVGTDGASSQGNVGGNVQGEDGASVQGEDGESVQGQAGESVQGEDGESVQGQDGESVQGRDGESRDGQDGNNQDGRDGVAIQGGDGTAVDGQDGESATVIDERGEGSVMCGLAPQLQLIDGDDDGLITMDEIGELIEMVGGNEQLERTRDQAIEQGIAAIRYRDCLEEIPGATPAASPSAAGSKD